MFPGVSFHVRRVSFVDVSRFSDQLKVVADVWNHLEFPDIFQFFQCLKGVFQKILLSVVLIFGRFHTISFGSLLLGFDGGLPW